ncbi:MAG: HAD-IA family hydrolase [Trueperaceae bacterium]|nr:HAD-IA family hydrolase [Trueperaceae bacterium]
MIRAIAFDWGGVFTEGTFDAAAVRALAAASGVPEATLEGPYLAAMAPFEEGAFDLAELHRRLEAAVDLGLDEATFRATFLGAIPDRPAMIDLLDAIPPAYVVGVLSNNVPELCDLVRDDPRMARVDHWVFSNEIGVRKPDPRAYAALVDAALVPADATVFVDDAERNVDAARTFGLHPVHLPDLATFADGWRATVPDVPLPASLLEATRA